MWHGVTFVQGLFWLRPRRQAGSHTHTFRVRLVTHSVYAWPSSVGRPVLSPPARTFDDVRYVMQGPLLAWQQVGYV